MTKLPSGWRIESLGNCCQIVSGSTPSRSKPEYWDGNISWVTPKDLSNLKSPILEDTPEKITEAGYKSCSTTLMPTGTILFSSRAPIGYVAIAGKPMCSNQGFKNLVPNSSVCSAYLYWCMRYFARNVAALGTGTTFKEVSKGVIEKFQIPLPPLEEQRRIAAILDKADAVRRKRQSAIALTEELLRSAFVEMFGIPEHSKYPVKTFAEVCEVIVDGAHFTPTYVDEGVPFLRVTDIQTKSINWTNTKHIPLDEHKELIKRCHPRKGDVLYSKNGTIGIPKLIDWDEEFSIFVSLALLRPSANVLLGGYLESFLKTPFALRQALNHTKTGTVSNLHLVEIRKVKLPVPSLEMQKQWLKRKSEIEKQRDKLIESFTQLDNLFNSLLQKAFRGQL